MENRFVRVCFALCLSCFNQPARAEEEARASRPPVRVYTNADLDRFAAMRRPRGTPLPPRGEGQGGGSIIEPRGDTPSAEAAPEPAVEKARTNAAEPRDDSRKEAHWRKEAARVRERVRQAEQSAEALRKRIDARWRRPGVLPSSDPLLQTWQSRLRAVEERVRELEADLDDRARRAGAFPGWLR